MLEQNPAQHKKPDTISHQKPSFKPEVFTGGVGVFTYQRALSNVWDIFGHHHSLEKGTASSI
jgi:hypothetical protein